MIARYWRGRVRAADADPGRLDVIRAGVVTTYDAGQTYVMPPGDRFEVRAAAPVACVCRFVGGTQP